MNKTPTTFEAGARRAGFQLAQRAAQMNPSVLRDLFASADRPGIVSLAGGLPSPEAFPVEALRQACARVLAEQPHEALQYGASEGFAPLREWLAGELRGRGMAVQAGQVLITTGSQQGLDLLGKVLIDPGCTVAVESPTYLGALQAFAPFEPRFEALACDGEGLLPGALRDAGRATGGVRFLYAQPNFQNPSGRCMGETRRAALVDAAQAAGIPIVEDDPYGELWFDAPPPPPLAARWAEGAVYLGSFSKVLAPSLRLGYVVAPPALFSKLLQAKQAADLHTPGFNQRVVFEVVRHGFLRDHAPLLRARYEIQRDAMAAALRRHLPPGCRWQLPSGGMFFWVELPDGIDAAALLPQAVERGVAYVPGAAFFAGRPRANTLRLSFATASAAQIEAGVAVLGTLLHEAVGMPARAARAVPVF